MSIRCIFGFVLSFRTTFVGVLLEPTVFRVVSALSTVPTFNRILVLVLVLTPVSSLLSLLSLLPFAFTLAVLAFALFAPAFAKRTDVHWVVSSWVSRTFLFHVWCCVASTLTICFDFLSLDTIRSQSRTVQLYVFLEIIWQQSFKGTHANVFRKIVCISLGISSATIASHEIFHLLDGTHQLRQFHLCRRQNLPQETSCSSRCVRIPPSVQLAPTLEAMVTPPADMTVSKLSPSV